MPMTEMVMATIVRRRRTAFIWYPVESYRKESRERCARTPGNDSADASLDG